MRQTFHIVIITALLGLLATTWANLAHADWTNDPFTGFVTVAGTGIDEGYPFTCQLAGGRTFVAWRNRYLLGSTDSCVTFYQILDPFGQALLAANGVPLITGGWQTNGYQVLPDGQGGCISVLSDKRDGSWDLWGQRVDSLGNRLWGDTGLPLVIWPGPASQEAYSRDFNCDSLGNFFLSYIGYAIYTQKFNASGDLLWGPLGAQVSQYYGYGQSDQQAVPDGMGGDIEIFESHTSPTGSHLRVQHLDSTGQPLLTPYGIPVRMPGGDPMFGSIVEGVPDGAGGGIWTSYFAFYPHVYVQVWRLNGMGQMVWKWTADNTSWNQGPMDLIRHPDGTFWMANSRIDGRWLYHFSLGGVQLLGQEVPYGGYLVPASNGIIAVYKYTADYTYGIYARRLDSGGNLLWASNVGLIGTWFLDPVADGKDGVVVGFDDERLWPNNYNICAQRINADGTLGTPAKIKPQPQPGLEGSSTGPFNFILDQAGPVRIELYDLLGRKVALLEDDWREAGAYYVPWNDQGLASGIYLLRIVTTGITEVRKAVVVR